MPKGAPQNKTIKCKTCVVQFIPKNNTQGYCSAACKKEYAKCYGSDTTERQYQLISGNWGRYFNRLCARSFNRAGLNKEILINILQKQNYKCALTGVVMTCTLKKGYICKTNASIDRIDPKGEYTINNIQLVCAVINKFRVDTPIEEFIDWCRKVAKYAVRK